MVGQATVTAAARPTCVVAAGSELRGVACVRETASAVAVACQPCRTATEVSRALAEVVAGVEQGQRGPIGPPGLAGIYNEVLAIETKNVIPPLSLPWKAAPGAFANIIVGSVTLVSGGGAVTFADGSRDVAFNPDTTTGGAGFNLDPGDVVVAQYNIG